MICVVIVGILNLMISLTDVNRFVKVFFKEIISNLSLISKIIIPIHTNNQEDTVANAAPLMASGGEPYLPNIRISSKIRFITPAIPISISGDLILPVARRIPPAINAVVSKGMP